jgi:3D (Asp-Asp-Asp) domain-containing protein
MAGAARGKLPCRAMPRTRWIPAMAALVLMTGCAGTGRKLPPFEKPLKPAPVQTVRTTAYTHTEADHRKYGKRAADGEVLKRGAVNSAAADWSRWPLGTKFRLAETGDIYEVHDYGWMLSGTNTIDLYKPTRSVMNRWGVRRVTIEIIEWGDPQRSYAVLKPRERFAHVKRMIRQLEDRHDL